MQHVSPCKWEKVQCCLSISVIISTHVSFVDRKAEVIERHQPHHSSRHIDKLGGLSGSGQQPDQECINDLRLNTLLTVND